MLANISRHSVLILSQNHLPVFFETMKIMYDVHIKYNGQPISRVLILDKKKNVLDCTLLIDGYFQACVTHKLKIKSIVSGEKLWIREIHRLLQAKENIAIFPRNYGE